MKTAIVHDWLISLGGAEKVLFAILDIYPSPVFTLIKSDQTFQDQRINLSDVKTSFIQSLPFSVTAYRNYLPLFPRAIQQFDLQSYDLVISSSHAVAKGVKIHPHQLHICYCHTPFRYVWDLHDHYMKTIKGIKGYLGKIVCSHLKKWDFKTANHVDHFIANSHYVANRIQRNYNRHSHVIYPPVATHLFRDNVDKRDFYLTASRLVSYKRIDVIVEAFRKMPKKQLYIIGEGPEEKKLKQHSASNIHFLGFQSDFKLREYLKRAKAFIFAAEEDFGIVPVEAQAAGTPVIAYGKGGALETVIPFKTGIFFDEQTPEKIQQAVKQFEDMTFNTDEIRLNAARFSESRFKKEMQKFIEEKWKVFCEDRYLSRR